MRNSSKISNGVSLSRYIATQKKLIDTTLDRYLPKSSKFPKIIHSSIRYCVFPGGKRIRPILAISACEACGGKARDVIFTACGIELIHTYTLIHDDLPSLDNDNFRRGRPTCHKKFGEAIAVLTGDALLTLAFEFLSRPTNKPEKQMRVIREVSKAIGTAGTIGGQVVDIECSRFKVQGSRTSAMKRRLDYIILHKTASLIAVSVKIGGIMAGANSEKIKVLQKFGSDIGFVFQLTDDLIDQDGYVKLLGKEKTQRFAENIAQRAKSCLKIFGEDSNILRGLADLILNREF